LDRTCVEISSTVVTQYRQIQINYMDIQQLFAKRIGGQQFGKVQQTFKFTLINNAKLAFIAKNPTIKVIDMGVGEPEEIPSERIIATLEREARLKENRIYPCNGILQFQESAARYLERDFGIAVDPETEVMHCVGTKTALAQIPLAFVDPGDAVIATIPGYPVLPKVAGWLGGRVFNLPLEAKYGFLPEMVEFEELVRRERPKLVLLNYPNNPTGAAATLDFFQRVVALAHEYSFLIVQDAAYADYVFEGKFVSPLLIQGGKDVTLELYSLSKSYNMQGYRLGFVAGGAALVKAFALVKDNTDNGQFIAIQRAGMYALDSGHDFLCANRNKYKRRLERVTAILNMAGIEARVSASTFYLYVKVPEIYKGEVIKSAQHMADILISRHGLITVPWDEAGSYLRFSMTFEVGNQDFANEEDVLRTLENRLIHDRLD
jgi:LL-diaminopimelate aminotransferase